MLVPVVDRNRNTLMPTSPARARRWVRDRKATGFWQRGIYCVRLNVDPSDGILQPITVGIDPGSKKIGMTVKSSAHTCLNIQADSVSWVKDAVEVRRNMRRTRRLRKTPCRANRQNRGCLRNYGMPPSTKARWQWMLRLVRHLKKLYPIDTFIVEDIKARTWKGKGGSRNQCFSPLQVGKAWFYDELWKLGYVQIKQGWETKELRDQLGLHKTSHKMAETFSAHCVDSWVLANFQTGNNHDKPDNTDLLCITPLQFHRRQLHVLQPAKGGVRKLYGGTMSYGFKRGSLVVHPKYGLAYVGGAAKNRISLHDVGSGKRLCQNAKPTECQKLTYNNWRVRNVQSSIPPSATADGLLEASL